MGPNDRTRWGIPWVRRLMPVALLLLLPLVAPLANGQQGKEGDNNKELDKKTTQPSIATDKPPAQKDTKKPTQARSAPRAMTVHFIDGSSMKLRLRDERIELTTPYGKLLIPVRDIERIEFATRIPNTLAKRIEATIAELGHEEFQR